MAAVVLADSSALVAVFHQRDQFHSWAVRWISILPLPLVTCEAVITETFFLLEKRVGVSELLHQALERGILTTDFGFSQERTATLGMMRRYANVPMSFADACLVRMAELHSPASVFTADRDFLVYRKHRQQPIPLISPW